MIIRYRRYLQNGASPCPPLDSKVIRIPCLFVPSRTLSRHSWVRPFIVYTLPCLGSC